MPFAVDPRVKALIVSAYGASRLRLALITRRGKPPLEHREPAQSTDRPQVGVTSDETFFSGNVGGGVKWYAPNNRSGLRGDYRFQTTKGKDDAPAFFGRDTRYVHRVYAGLIINTSR
jgi:hypothetical protein